MKRKNPYTTLLEAFRSYYLKIKYRGDILSFYYDIDKVINKELFSLDSLYYKTEVANELGFDTYLKTTKIGLEVHFVSKLPEQPYQI